MIYCLRHELRDMKDPTFDSKLTSQGVINAQTTLLYKLLKLHIDYIYCSPFIRCLQTVIEYSKIINIPIYIDYRLCEKLEDESFNTDTAIRTLSNEELVQYNATVIHSDVNIKWPETNTQMKSRVKEFIESIDNETNILVCSHESIIKEIITIKLGYNYCYHKMGTIYPICHTNVFAFIYIFTFLYTLLPYIKLYTYLRNSISRYIPKFNLRNIKIKVKEDQHD